MGKVMVFANKFEKTVSQTERQHLPVVVSEIQMLSPKSLCKAPVAKNLRQVKNCKSGVNAQFFFELWLIEYSILFMIYIMVGSLYRNLSKISPSE